MSKYLRLAKKQVDGEYFTELKAWKVVALSLLSIADSLERLADCHGRLREDGYDAEEEEC